KAICRVFPGHVGVQDDVLQVDDIVADEVGKPAHGLLRERAPVGMLDVGGYYPVGLKVQEAVLRRGESYDVRALTWGELRVEGARIVLRHVEALYPVVHFTVVEELEEGVVNSHSASVV